MDSKKMSWSEAEKYMWDFNKREGIITKSSGGGCCEMVAVITEDSFNKPYSLTERSYHFNNHNKAFIPNMLGKSIFASCLDGKDLNVRLDYMLYNGWKVEYCYITNETKINGN